MKAKEKPGLGGTGHEEKAYVVNINNIFKTQLSESQEKINETACAMAAQGLSVIPVNPKSKKSETVWKDRQEIPYNPEQLAKMKIEGIGIIAGWVSGNVECIDFDFLAAYFEPWKQIVESESLGLTKRLLLQKTQSNGLHVVYRCKDLEIPGSQELAFEKIQVDEQGTHEYQGKKLKAQKEDGVYYIYPCMIETRGTGAYFLAAPSPGYEVINGDSFLSIPEITFEERGILIRAAKALNKKVETSKEIQHPRKQDCNRPGDIYNKKADIRPLLQKHGWIRDRTRGDYEHWTRPGKERGVSASLIDGKFFYVFTTNAPPFQPEKAYSFFGVYTCLEHAGDFEAAAKALKKQGYGDDMYVGSHDNPSSRESNNDHPFDRNGGCVGYVEESKCAELPQPPLNSFHPIVARAFIEISEAKNVPIEIAIAAYLALVSALIGRSRGIKIKPGWVEYANLFIALVGRSGVGKSPVVAYMFKIIYQIEKEYQKIFEDQMLDYEQEMLAWKAKSKKKDGNPGPKPEIPTRKDILLDDTTIEALTDSLADNPKGILWNRDELAGMILEFDKYSGKDGATKKRLMMAYDSGPWKVNRINNQRTGYIPYACISIFGSIQPKAAKKVFTGYDAATGFLARFNIINAVPRKPAFFSEKFESEKTDETLRQIISGLNQLRVEDSVNPIPCSFEAKKKYIEWHNEQAIEAWLGTEGDDESMLHKIRAQCLRIALGLHCVDAILNNKNIDDPVSADVMQRACDLTDWLKAHAKIVWSFLSEKSCIPTSREVRVASAVLDLVDQIKDAMLPTNMIVEKVNENHQKHFHLSPDIVGKTLKSLGLTNARNTRCRGWEVNTGILDKLRSLANNPVMPDMPVRDQKEQGFQGMTGSRSTCHARHNEEDVEIF